ncbi:MAG TPA: DUF2339 domain-containing protein [Polyangiales bacterium]|nr:DUF2339 domain-containing protein [Polyangiales bacterium]
MPAPALAPTPPRTPALTTPAQPDPFETAFAFLRDLLFGGNTLVRAGIVVLLVGVVLLLRLAAEHDMLPIELRFAAAAALATGLIVVGFRQRTARPGFSRTLQGGGVAGLYLVVFFAFRSYALLPAPLAFVLLAAIAVFSGALAVQQNSLSLILIAQLFGFLAPLLASTGKGSHVGLFSYYLLLNLVIGGIAWFKAWRPLNLVGFAFTFGVASAWGVLRYEPQHFASTEPFLIAFFLLYVALPVMFALRHPGSPRGWVDASLVFGTPLAALGLQWSMVHERPFAMAYTALGMAAVYLCLAFVMKRRAPERLAALGEAFLPIGAGFVTLAIPYGFDNHNLTGAAWALEGAGLYWIGARQKRWLSRLAGVVLQFLAGGALLLDPVRPEGSWPLLNTWFLAGMLLGLSSLCVAYLSHAAREQLPREWRWVQVLIGWGLFFVIGVGEEEIAACLPDHIQPGCEIAWFGAIGLGLELAAGKLGFRPGRYPGLGLWPIMLFFLLRHHYDYDVTPLERGGYLGWPVYAAAMLAILIRFVGEPPRSAGDRLSPEGSRPSGASLPTAPAFVRYAHPTALWLWGAWCVSLVDQAVADHAGLDRNYVYAASIVCMVAILLSVLAQRERLGSLRKLYMFVALGGAAATLLLRVFQANLTRAGSDTPIGYLPILNALDLSMLMAFGAVGLWLRRTRDDVPEDLRGVAGVALAGMAFVFWNGLLARSVHHYAHVPFDPDALWDSVAMQVSISLSWTVIALGLMIFAHRRRVRPAWFAGAMLLGVIVPKLFLLDLAELSALAKIGTFLGVGMLLLLVGAVAPVPPTAATAPETPA